MLMFHNYNYAVASNNKIYQMNNTLETKFNCSITTHLDNEL